MVQLSVANKLVKAPSNVSSLRLYLVDSEVMTSRNGCRYKTQSTSRMSYTPSSLSCNVLNACSNLAMSCTHRDTEFQTIATAAKPHQNKHNTLHHPVPPQPP